MRIEPMYIYRQTNSGGKFDYTEKAYVENKIYPVRVIGGYDEGRYVYIGVFDDNDIPEMVYFDGVKYHTDCAHCGDRWSRLDDDIPANVRIFDNSAEFNEYKDSLPLFAIYCILTDFEKESEKTSK